LIDRRSAQDSLFLKKAPWRSPPHKSYLNQYQL
jgi:hypothetical protein